MKNKKIFIVSLILCNVFSLYILFTMVSLINRFNEEVSTISDDYIYMYNYRGYKTSEMEKIKDNTSVEEAKFYIDNNLSYSYSSDKIIDNIKKTYYTGGNYLYDGVNTQDNLKFLEGSKLENKTDVIISQSAADIIIEQKVFDKATNYNDLIGKNLLGYTVVGVYEGQEITSMFPYFEVGEEPHVIQTQSCYDCYYILADENLNENPEDAINSINEMEAYSYDNGYNYKNGTLVWTEPTAEDLPDTKEGSFIFYPTIDYDASVANGAKGLMDPGTASEYGDSFNTVVTIKVNDPSVKGEVIKMVNDMYPDQMVLTSDSKLSDYRNVNLYVGIVFAMMVLMNLILLVPCFKIHFGTKR